MISLLLGKSRRMENGKRKKLYQFRCGMAVILAVAMIFGMVPEVVYAMPETGVEHMEYMFQKCCALKALDLSSFDTAQSKNFDRMFYDCTDLETLDISGFTIQSGAEDMLLRCNSLREIKTPKQTDQVIALPETEGVYSRRTEDGTKVSEFPTQSATVSLGKKIGVGFTGSNFKLEGYEDKSIEDVILKPYEIEPDYPKGDLTNLTVSDGSQIS